MKNVIVSSVAVATSILAITVIAIGQICKSSQMKVIALYLEMSRVEEKYSERVLFQTCIPIH